MSRVLLVSNDFPPRRGGIQSYLQELVDRLVAAGTHTLTGYAPKWKGADDFDRDAGYEVVRHPGTLMLPVPAGAGPVGRPLQPPHRGHRWVRAAPPLAVLAPPGP